MQNPHGSLCTKYFTAFKRGRELQSQSPVLGFSLQPEMHGFKADGSGSLHEEFRGGSPVKHGILNTESMTCLCRITLFESKSSTLMSHSYYINFRNYFQNGKSISQKHRDKKFCIENK